MAAAAANQTKMKFLIFLGSTRDGRNGERVVKAVVSRFVATAPHIETEVIDPLVYDLPVLRQALHFYPDPMQAPAVLREIDAKIRAADAYIIVSPEYNRNVPPALSNMLNHFSPKAYHYKASGVIGYSMGGAGGCVAAIDLRRLMCEMGAPPVSQTPAIPGVTKAIDSEGKFLDEAIIPRIDRLITQVIWMATAMKRMRDSDGIPA